MEGDKIYEDSKKEITRVLSSLGADAVIINLNKLDGVTKEHLVSAIQRTLSERSRSIDKVTLGVK